MTGRPRLSAVLWLLSLIAAICALVSCPAAAAKVAADGPTTLVAVATGNYDALEHFQRSPVALGSADLLVVASGAALNVNAAPLSNFVAADTTAVEAGPLAGTTYSPKVISQMASGDAHGFTMDGTATWGDAATAQGGDGAWYLHVNVPGSVNGESGFYQYIVDQNGVINHRFWSGQSSIDQFWMTQK